jgi:hypothetical protein
MQLTEHFTLAEATHSDAASRYGIDNTPPDRHLSNILHTAQRMEQVRKVLGGKIILVSSWYRSPELNRAIGGSMSSAHTKGLAVDFTCPDFGSVLDVCVAIRDSDIVFDQLIYEYGRWIHFGLCACPQPRRQVLTKLANRPYALGLPGA